MYEVKELQPLFAAYFQAGMIQARWFSGELRAGKGDLVRYVHDGFNRNMETERVLTLRNGKVLKTQTYHNYRRTGLNLMYSLPESFWDISSSCSFTLYISNLSFRNLKIEG